MNTDLEMEEAQIEYEKNQQKKTEIQRTANSPSRKDNLEPTLGIFFDKDDIQMPEQAPNNGFKDPNDLQVPGSSV